MAIILGIDPGSRVTGYGVIRQVGRQLSYLGSGCIRTSGRSAVAAEADLRRGDGDHHPVSARLFRH